jgi:hypothetical protein
LWAVFGAVNFGDKNKIVGDWVNERNSWACGSKVYNHYTQVRCATAAV